jgi:hypothetical protein
MSQDSYDILRRAVVEALGSRPAPERRRQIAADLRALAEQQERMAERDEARAKEPPPRAIDGTGRAQRPVGFYVRLKHEQDPHLPIVRLRVSLGGAIWAALGSPERIEIQRVGPNVWIVPSTSKAAHELDTRGSLPSCVVDLSGPLGQHAPGRYAATIHAGALVVGERLA